MVRYADDAVVFCESRDEAEKARDTLTAWLRERGLILSREKTRIVHLREGFDYLGFNIRHYPAPKTTKSGYKLLIKPSKQVVQALRKKLRETWVQFLGTNVKPAIGRLNPIIRGWANYFRTGVAKRAFRILDRWMFRREVRYAKRTHPNKRWR